MMPALSKLPQRDLTEEEFYNLELFPLSSSVTGRWKGDGNQKEKATRRWPLHDFWRSIARVTPQL